MQKIEMSLGTLLHPQFGASMSKLMKSMTLPTATCFRLRGVKRSVDTELAKYNEIKDSYIAEYGERGDDGKLKMSDLGDGKRGVELREDKAEECKQKLKELQELKVGISTIPISVIDLETLDLLTPEDFCFLEFIVEDEA